MLSHTIIRKDGQAVKSVSKLLRDMLEASVALLACHKEWASTLISCIASMRSIGMRAGPIQCGAGMEASIILISPISEVELPVVCGGL